MTGHDRPESLVTMGRNTHAGQNRAKQVLDVLGWANYESYLQDMRTLLQ
jgi:hypothetical protein